MKDLEKIIRYFDGEMKGEERLLFEQELVTDKSLNQSKLLMDEIDKAIDDDQLFAFKAKLAETQTLCNAINDANYVVGDDVHPKAEKIVHPKISWKYVASAIIALLVVSTVLFYNFSRSSNDKIFASFYHRYEANYEAGGINSRSADVTKVSKLINAVQLYDLGNFNGAISQFNEIIKADPENTAAHFFEGLAQMENNDYNRAVENLLFVISKKDIPYIEQSEWYLALCYLKLNKDNEAVNLLTRIANGESYYKIMATELLKKIQ
jgi:tetratricopeptide (TPR) repeat protein